MFLITSANYITEELSIELGKIPSAFVPVGNKRLYVHQINLIKKFFPDENICITIPSTFVLNHFDKKFFRENSINVLKIPVGLTLCESINYFLESFPKILSCKILHGDTLFYNLPDKENSIIVSTSEYDYIWGDDTESNNVFAGYFSFNEISILKKALRLNNWSFENAIIYYDTYSPLTRILYKDWLDFGHVNTYFKSRSQIDTTRDFNDSHSNGKIFTKSSQNELKIKAEINWYQNLSDSVYIPKLLGFTEKSYNIEYFPLIPLNELFIYGIVKPITWKYIFKSCKEFLDSLKQKGYKENKDFSIYSNKTLDRLKLFSCQTGFDINKKIIFNKIEVPSLLEIANDCILEIPNYTQSNIIHGDFCLSNILYNYRNKSIKVIDPRGLDGNNNISIYGDYRYDIAKLAHSVIGGYDYIIAGITKASINTDGEIFFSPQKINKEIINIFWSIFNEDKNVILNIVILLFLSMLPLHNDSLDKQITMLSTAIYLYMELKK